MNTKYSSVDAVEISKKTPRPIPLTPILDNIPAELKDKKSWVIWRYDWMDKQKKWTKPPYNGKMAGLKAKSDDPTTWCCFSEAVDMLKTHRGFDGIGLVMTDDLVGIDLDHCRQDEKVADWAIEVIEKFNSYTEFSPSGTGIRIFVRGHNPCDRTKVGNVELYDKDSPHYLTVTGHRVGQFGTKVKADRQAELQWFADKYLVRLAQGEPKTKETSPVIPTAIGHDIATDDEIIDLATKHKGDRFVKLLAGQWEQAGKYPSQSEADAAFVYDLAFYTGDIEQIRRIFAKSGLYRDKWERPDYSTPLIEKAIATTDKYNWTPRHDKDGGIETPVEEVLKSAASIPESGATNSDGNPTSPDGVGLPDLEHCKGGFSPSIVDMTDLGNATLFVSLYGNNLRKVREWKSWIKWTGIYWKPVSLNHVIAKYVHRMVTRDMVDMTKRIADNDKRTTWFKWISQSNQSFRMEAIEKEAGRILEVEVNDLNRNPDLFALSNAVINLKTCQQVTPCREDYITVATPVKFDPKADCPMFKRFIADILINNDGTACPEMVEYMQRALGYCLTPSTSEQIFFILYGIGKNGKSTLMDTLQFVLGEYAIQGSDTLYFDVEHRANNEDEARLYGKRVCVTSETKDSAYFNAPKIKKLTGGDRIAASFKYQTQFEFLPSHKLLLLCNHLPRFDANDEALTRRIKLLPFNYVVPTDRQDRDLALKLRTEASGIVNWMLAGLQAYNSGKHLGDEYTPQIMKVVKQTYLASNDELEDFIDEYTIVGEYTTKADLYNAYGKWCGDNGKHALSAKNLGAKLMGKGWQDGKVGKDSVRCWQGRKLKPTMIETVQSIVTGL